MRPTQKATVALNAGAIINAITGIAGRELEHRRIPTSQGNNGEGSLLETGVH